MYILGKNHTAYLVKILKPKRKQKYVMQDMYYTVSGISLSLEVAGFKVTGMDRVLNHITTYNHNLIKTCLNKAITTEHDFSDAGIVVCGPPYQPFSICGKQDGM